MRVVKWFKQPVGSAAERVFYLLAFAFLVAARFPDILLKGRFWAEEGTSFFATAWLSPWWKAIVTPYGGYLDLVPSIGGVVAFHLLPLSAAPYGNTVVALAVQCIPAALIVCSRHSWLQPRFVMIAAVLLVGMAVAADEVWLSSIGCTAHLALATALILGLEVPAAGLLVFQLCVLLLAALTAPGSWPLTVLFLARAVIERSKGRALQGLVLLFGVILQLLFFYSQFGGRSVSIAPSVFGAVVFVKNVLIPFLGGWRADDWARALAAHYTQEGGPIWPLLVSVVLFLVLAAFALRRTKEPPFWLVLAAAVIAASGYIGAFDSDKVSLIAVITGSRYAVAGQILIGIALLSASRIFPDRTRFAAGILAAWLLAIDFVGYFKVVLPDAATGPAWREEVAAWRRDQQHVLRLWPEGWTLELPPKSARP